MFKMMCCAIGSQYWIKVNMVSIYIRQKIQQFTSLIQFQYISQMAQEPNAKPTIGQLYQEGDFIDAKDNQADWRVGYIVSKSINTHLFKVRFDGWPSKYDQFYKFNSLKLRPFRTLVIGYTGQKQNPAIREGWTFTPQNIKQRTQQLQSFIKNPMSLNVHQLNQFIRGHNYFYVDFLMTTKFTNQPDFQLAIAYFRLNIEMFVQYLNLIQANFNEYMKTISTHKEMEEMTETQAYFYSFFEIFDTIYTIFGNYDRLDGFFKQNEEFIKKYFDVPPSKDHKKAFKQDISKYLVELKGIDIISKILDIILKREECIPFFFLSAFTHLVQGIMSLFVVTFRENLLESLLKIGQDNVKKLKDSQIKQLHRSDVSTFIEALVFLSRGTKWSQSIEQWATLLELSLSLKMILCPFFERKLKGISHIIQVCERHEIVINKNDQFRAWINTNNLFQVLFQMNDNHEIIKKSCELTKFLVLRKLLRPEDIDIIWNSRVGKHETVVKQIYNLIGELPYYEKEVSQNLNLFRKIAAVPREQWDEDYIHMIKVFSQNSYGFNTKEHMGQTFGFKMIYEYAIDTQKEFAINQLVSLLSFFEHSQIFNKFQETCFLDIGKRHKEKTNIKILLAINKENIETFNKLDISLIQILIDSLLVHASSQDSEIITQTFDLLSAVTKNTDQEIEVDLFIKLWKGFMHSINKDLFIKWLYRKKQNGRVYLSFCLTDKIKKYLLINLWKNDEELQKITEEESILIIELFKYTNENAQKLRKPHPMTIQVVNRELIGYNILWKILKEVEDDNAATLMSDFLAEIYTSYQDILIEEAIIFHAKHLIYAINDSLQNKNWRYLVRLLHLFKKTIDYDDQIYSIKFPTRHQFPKEYIVQRKDINEEYIIKFSCTSIFYEFKKNLSSKLGLPLQKFYLVSGKGVKLTRQHFYKTMIEPPLTGGKFQLILREEKSTIKGAFNKYLDVLFNLLDDSRIEKLVWSIVQRLPISEQVKSKVTKTENIFYELQHMGFYKQLYMLKVMLELDDQWWLKLTMTKPISEVTNYLAKITFKTQIQEEYVIALTRIIIKMLKIAQDHHQVAVPEGLFARIATVLVRLFSTIEKEGPKSLEAEEKIIKNIFEIAQHVSLNQNAIKDIIDSELSESIFNTALINIPAQQIRKRFVEQFKGLLKYWHHEKDWKILNLLLGKLLTNAINTKNKDNLKEYFTLTSHMLSKCPLGVIEQVYKHSKESLVPKLFHLIQHEKSEQSNEAVNKALQGYFTLLKHLIRIEDNQIQTQVLNYLVNECLFSRDDPKCKSCPARKQAFGVLLELSESDQNVSAILPFLTDLHKKGHWRSKRLEDWGITIHDKLKSPTGYVGLKNLGCICYMNSFNQQLFMIPYFRYSITNADDLDFNKIDSEQNVLYQVQKMFMNLEYSDKKYYNPKPFCHAFKDYEGNPTNVAEQMDIDQYSNILFDRLEHQLKKTQYSTLIKDMFGGVFSNQIVCKGCPHYSQSQEPFLNVSLTVKNKKNIYQSFENMIQGDTLDGDNAYYCQRCSKKVSAVKRMSLKKLPNHLIVTLKRFQFDYERMMKLKVNDYCEFPINLNLKQYSQQYLRKQENAKAMEEQQTLSNDYFNYILKGFVVHVGHADSGHYYSFIQDRQSNKWYQFNDTIVRDFDIANLAQQAFGGETSGYDARQKIKNAYMLIYERQKKIPIGNEIAIKRRQIQKKEINNNILQEIVRENKAQKLQNILFSREYTRYMLGILSRSDKLDFHIEKKILKYAIIFYLTITIREKNEGINEFILKRISRSLEKHPDLAEWVLSMFSNEKIYDEFFLHNFFRQTRKFLAYWLVSLYKLSSFKVKVNFCNSLLAKVSSRSQNFIDICLILFEICQGDTEMLEQLIKRNILGRMITNITKEKQKFKEVLEFEAAQSQIGYQEQIEKNLLQELKNRKLRLSQSQNQYVWGLITLVIEYAQQRSTTIKELLPEEQYRCLELPEPKIYKILEQIKNKYGIYYFTRYISEITTNNQPFLLLVVNIIYKGLKQFQSKRYRQFMLLTQQIIRIKDDLMPIRLDSLNKIVEALKFNEQYSSDSNIIQQWIIILLNRNQNLRQFLVKETEILNYLYDLPTKKVPSDEISKKNIKYAEAMINKLHGVKFLCAKKGYLKLAGLMRQFYKMIIEDNFEPSPYWPSRPDDYRRQRQIGDKVGYFDINGSLDYEESTIQSMALGKIQLSQGKNKTFTIWKDDQKLINEVPLEVQCEFSEGSSSKATDQLEEDDNGYIDAI